MLPAPVQDPFLVPECHVKLKYNMDIILNSLIYVANTMIEILSKIIVNFQFNLHKLLYLQTICEIISTHCC